MASWRLNDEQRQFAAEHHDEVVYGFLSVRQLDQDEYLDIVYPKYLYAVHIYLERPELQRYSFKTVAYRQMMGAVKDYWTYLNRPKRKVPAVPMQNAEQLLTGMRETEIIPMRMYERADAVQQWRRIAPLLTEKETDALRFKAMGYTYAEIANLLGISPSGVDSRFRRMRKRIRNSIRLSANSEVVLNW